MPKVKRYLPLSSLDIYVKRYLPRYLPLRVFTSLPTGLLPILFRIFSKFREISQICKYGERKNLQVNTLRVFTWVNTQVKT